MCLLITLMVGTSCYRMTNSQLPKMLELKGDLRVHDPVMIRQGEIFYVFSTGGRRRGGIIPIRCSRDLYNWKYCGAVFDELPEWASIEIPGTRGAWAPDISFFNGKYHIYYSISTFGKNNSAIGLVTNHTLNPNSPDYQWQEHGMIVRSVSGSDNYNAIDGNLVLEDPDKAWLCWGSFWGGIKMRRIDKSTGKLSSIDTTLYSLASRPGTDSDLNSFENGAIEAPFIIKHAGMWYLFVSFDLCCRGVDSTYKIMVGRSQNVTGPYKDRENKLMTDGGGSLVLQATTPNWRGPGHCAIVQDVSGDSMNT